PVERVDVATRETEPLANGADEAVDFAVDVRLGVARVFDRQNEVAVLDTLARRVEGEAARPERENAGVALERDVDDDAVAREIVCQVRVGIAEVAAPVPGDIDLYVL